MALFSTTTSSAIRFASRLSAQYLSQDLALEAEVLNLFDLMQVRLLRYAVSFGISVQDGEDIVQETFLALFHHLQQSRIDDNLHGWLFRVAHNLALKRRGKNHRESAGLGVEEIDRFDPVPNPEERMLLNEQHARFQSVLQALPAKDQMCLRLRNEGLRYREIAKIVGMSLGGVSASLSRSLSRLEQADMR
jgi:RNA polymerase sigma-70 factor, ECF subfamily